MLDVLVDAVAAVDKIGGEAAECACGHSDRANQEKGQQRQQAEKSVLPDVRFQPAFNYGETRDHQLRFLPPLRFGSLRP